MSVETSFWITIRFEAAQSKRIKSWFKENVPFKPFFFEANEERLEFNTYDTSSFYLDERIEPFLSRLEEEFPDIDHEAVYSYENCSADAGPIRTSWCSASAKLRMEREEAERKEQDRLRRNREDRKVRQAFSRLGIPNGKYEILNERSRALFSESTLVCAVREPLKRKRGDKKPELSVGEAVQLWSSVREDESDGDKAIVKVFTQPPKNSFSSGALVGELLLEGDCLNLVALNAFRCVAFVHRLDPIEVRIDLLPDAEEITRKHVKDFACFSHGQSGSLRFKSPRTYLKRFPERAFAFGLEVDEAKLSKAKGPGAEEVARLKKDWGFKRDEPGRVFYKGTDVHVEVPVKIGKRQVTGLGREAFAAYGEGGALGSDTNRLFRSPIGDVHVETVTCPDGLETIGFFAFTGSSVTKLEVPASLKEVDADAFFLSRLSEIVVRGSEEDFLRVSSLLEKPASEMRKPCRIVRAE